MSGSTTTVVRNFPRKAKEILNSISIDNNTNVTRKVKTKPLQIEDDFIVPYTSDDEKNESESLTSKPLSKSSKKNDSVNAITKTLKNTTLDDSKTNLINDIHKYLNNIKNDEIRLLKELDVLRWLFADETFLNTLDNKKEKAWGNKIMNITGNKQWTTLFGQNLVHELYLLIKEDIESPPKMDNKIPDWISEHHIIEVKTRTYKTEGTAGEKILGTPFKYANMPRLHERDLRIICVGYQEVEADIKFGLFNPRSDEHKKYIAFYKEMQTTYHKYTDLLQEYIKIHKANN